MAGGLPIPASCWRWSEISLEDAQQQADSRLMELAQLLQAGTPLDRYAYSDRLLREQIVQTIRPNAVVLTRNLYGAVVLNTSNAMFIDIDFAAQNPTPSGSLLGRLFGRSTAAPGPQELAVQRIRQWTSQRRDLGLRVYRTFAGLRCLVTTRTFDPKRSETIDLLRDVGSDPLYIRLCQAQARFRARLSPKPWRCGLRPPPVRYPWTRPQDELRFRQWQLTYEQSIQGYGVCTLLDRLGSTAVHSEIAPIIALHDQFACKQPAYPLA
jgi:hypothetical protein